MTRGPFCCVWLGSSSFSPEYFGLGNALEIDVRLDVRDMLMGVIGGMSFFKKSEVERSQVGMLKKHVSRDTLMPEATIGKDKCDVTIKYSRF